MPPARSDPRRSALLASPDWPACEGMIRSFEAAWRRGEVPAIGDYLHGSGAARQLLLVELAHIDLEFRLRRGEPARVEAYLESPPEIEAARAAVLGLVAAELELRQRQEAVSLDEYRLRFPEHLDDLLDRLTGRAVTWGDSTLATPGPPAAPPRVPGYE